MRPLKEKVSITLDYTTVEKIKQLAEKDERSFSQYINKVPNKHITEAEQTSNK